VRLHGIAGVASGFVVAGNIVYGNAPDFVNRIGAREIANLVSTDPMFVSTASTPDLHLKAGSPAIDGARADVAADTDFDGVRRPVGAGVDAGAYEFVPAADRKYAR
jgi:hypothetical protein